MIKNHWRFDFNYISQIDSRENCTRPQSTTTQEWGEISYTHIHKQAHYSPLRICPGTIFPRYTPKHCWPLRNQPALLGLTWRKSSKVPASHLWCLIQRIVQSTKNLVRTGINSHSPLFDLGQCNLSWKWPWSIILKTEKWSKFLDT